MTTTRKLWIGLLVLALLTPLGILLPHWFGCGAAWGEWTTGELHALLGYVPAKLQHLAGLWHAPLPRYSVSGAEHAGLAHRGLWYVLSAVVGLAAVAGLTLLLGRWLARNERPDAADTSLDT